MEGNLHLVVLFLIIIVVCINLKCLFDSPSLPSPLSSPMSNRAHEVHQRALRLEPFLTKMMKELAQKFGGKLEGLMFCVKSKESIASKLAAAGGRVESLTDVNRYTMVFPVKEYVKSVKSVIDALKGYGYVLNIKNYWQPGNPYQGINVAISGVLGASQVELQFHTPESLHVKETQLHSLYEIYRVSQDNHERWKLYQEMSRLAMQIPLPDWHVLNIGNLKYDMFKPYPDKSV